jgi:hypothetical protein
MKRPRTDFERYGIAQGEVTIGNRIFLLTVDFEAFLPTELSTWLDAMSYWARAAERGGWETSIFVALEDIVRVRATSAAEYRRFLGAAEAMAAAGATFYPHNHGVFDQRTGVLRGGRSHATPGYPKRASMFFDVVHRHRLRIQDWLRLLRASYEDFLADAQLPVPKEVAFRAGGWDYGGDATEVASFVEGLREAGFSWDSSASDGTYGTRSWRVGAPFGRNVFPLGPDVTEAASCWSADGLAAASRPRRIMNAARLGRQSALWRGKPGAFVTVFHFNNLLRSGTPSSPRELEQRVEAFFAGLGRLRAILGLTSGTFSDISVVDSNRALARY